MDLKGAPRLRAILRPGGLLPIWLLTGLAGCASVPKVVQTYYFPLAQQDVAIVQTMGCTITPVKAPSKKSKAHTTPAKYISTGPYSTATATVTTTYIADYSKRYTWDYTSVDNAFGDEDIAIGVTDDGRLSSINATGAGEGAAIITSAATVASVATGITPKAVAANVAPVSHACQMIQEYGTTSGNANPQGGTVYTLTLNYKLRVQTKFDQTAWAPAGEIIVYAPDGTTSKSGWNTPIPIPLNSGANPVPDKQLSGVAGNFTLTITRISEQPGSNADPALQPAWTSDSSIPSVAVPAIAELNASVSGPTANMKGSARFYDENVLAPTSTPVYIPVPTAPTFGKIATTAQFGPSGVVEKLEYNKAAALSDLIGSGAQIYNQLQPQTTAQKAAAVQAQADLIYQQQRLVTCELSAANCTT